MERDSLQEYGMTEARFRLGVRREFFTVWVEWHLKRLPREVVDALTLEREHLSTLV